MKFAQNILAALLAKNAIAVELSVNAQTFSMDCGERNDFVNTNFLDANYNNGTLIFSDDLKANLADRVC